MENVALIALVALQLYSYIVLGRIIIEMIASFSRDFRPPAWFATISEVLFVLTDPPLRALRRLIPPVRLGNVGLDMGVLALFLLIMVAQFIIQRVFL
ncbi:hypothetical protein C1Y63_07860 [Corynebacterium sp. 13CS0277]|uniref:YggT family protein n=1 Tax=Corynebacterium sp. 13CS0277 TaxID=2071994 RepID=UPI000D037787|nr:YggT family protein [Corynebacterium sp. 13CS0277]PRQ11158.1 hypothetical protein C1Y63_07860 [Corynebacterium sp. 13CS0277]